MTGNYKDNLLPSIIAGTINGNVLAGLAGTPPGYITLSETSMAYNIGARTQLANIIVALMCGLLRCE